MIINDGDMTSPSIEKALELLDRPADNLESYRIKGLGLRLVLMGLAEVQALRLSRLSTMVYALEQELLDPEKIRILEPKMLFGLYQLSSKALTESSEFVERTLKNIDWSEMETELLQVRATEVKPDKSGISAEDSEELLQFISRLKHEKDKSING